MGICLPDETRLAGGAAASAASGRVPSPGTLPESDGEVEVRRLHAGPRRRLAAVRPGAGRDGGQERRQLTVKTRGKALRKVRLMDVSQVCLFGNVQVTAQALREIAGGRHSRLPLFLWRLVPRHDHRA